MALGLTQSLTEMSTRNKSWGKGGRGVGLSTLPPSCAECLQMWEPLPPGTLRACQACNWIVFPLYLLLKNFAVETQRFFLCSL